jgi:hypothetical protein
MDSRGTDAAAARRLTKASGVLDRTFVASLAVKVKGVDQPDRRDSTRTRVDSGGKAGHRVCAEIVREEREFELIILEG